MANLDLCPQSLKALQMQVDGAGADGTAPGQGNLRLTAAGQQRPHDQEGSAHLAHQLIRRLAAADDPAVHCQLMFLCIEAGAYTQLPQNLGDGIDIFQSRHFVKDTLFFLSQKRSGNDGQHRILGPADLHPSPHGTASMYDKFFHSCLQSP